MSPARVIPLTPHGALWSQREYVACQQMGIEFAAHRADGGVAQWFHYGFPGDIGCTSILVDGGGPRKYIDHNFDCTINWLGDVRAALAKVAP
jgi:hypothetical protein